MKNNYWEGRNKYISQKKNFINNFVIQKILSIRFPVEFFLNPIFKNLLKNKKNITILDIGCGAGQDICSNKKLKFYGVDIKGFPKNIVLDSVVTR